MVERTSKQASKHIHTHTHTTPKFNWRQYFNFAFPNELQTLREKKKCSHCTITTQKYLKHFVAFAKNKCSIKCGSLTYLTFGLHVRMHDNHHHRQFSARPLFSLLSTVESLWFLCGKRVLSPKYVSSVWVFFYFFFRLFRMLCDMYNRHEFNTFLTKHCK